MPSGLRQYEEGDAGLFATCRTVEDLFSSVRVMTGENWSQLAKRLGVTPQHICNLRRLKKRMTLGTAVDLAKRLEVPEKVVIRVVLQSWVDRAGLRYDVRLVARGRQ